ncbi:tyrosine-type recombinase/integrase [Persephonella sp.]
MRLFKRENGIWYIEFERGKKRSLKTKDKALAQRLFNQLKREYMKGKLLQLTKQSSKIKFSEFRKEYLEWSMANHKPEVFKINKRVSKRWIEIIGDKYIAAYSRKDMDLFVSRLKDFGLSSTSININLRHIKSIFSKAVDWGYLEYNQFLRYKELRVQKKPPRFLTVEEIKKIERAIDREDFLLLFKFLIYTGARRSEAVYITWDDIDLNNNIIYFKKTKTYLSRAVPIHPELRTELEKLYPSVGRLFSFTHHWATKRLKHYFKKAGVDIRVHDLRHTFASQLVMSGVDLKTVQELLGHTDYKTTEIYAHLAPHHLQEAIKKLRLK